MVSSDKVKLFVEAGGAIAVLLGLVFVGLELRQNTSAVEAATFQSITDASSNYILTIAADPELVRIQGQGSRDVESLSEADRDRYFFLSRSFWVRMQNAYSQWQRGTLSDEDWKLYAVVICNDMGSANAGYRKEFDRHRSIVSEDLQRFIDSCWEGA